MEKKYVPFVSEVETFNATMGKPNTYTPNIPERKEWEFVYNFILEELEEYKEEINHGARQGISEQTAIKVFNQFFKDLSKR